MTFKEQLQQRGAREFHVAAFSGDETRALAAIDAAEQKGVEHVLGYALTLYEDPAWAPKGARSRLVTNAAVEVVCAHCHGDRFVIVTDGPGLYEETYAPCAYCNANANTEFWTADGRRHVTAAV